MTELQLYKFVKNNQLEYNHVDGDVILFVDFDSLKEFGELVKSFVSDGGLDVTLKQDYVGVHMSDLCDYYGVDLLAVFEKD